LRRAPSVKGIGPARFRLLLDTFGAAEAIWPVSPAAWQDAGLDARTTAAFEQQRRRIVPDAELERLVRLRIGVLRICDDAYPRLLREIARPPPVLYVRGALSADDDFALAVVGTRRATAYGRHVTERLSGELAGQRITIVSGLARGIDTYAHTAALEAGGRTIAVLGCGPDLVYPPENSRLAARIMESGALVTEFPPGTQPDAGNFPARNRLISGLSLGVLVTENPRPAERSSPPVSPPSRAATSSPFPPTSPAAPASAATDSSRMVPPSCWRSTTSSPS
jgi:DNA processing protein